MTSLNIDLCDIPPLHGKTAIITGGSSGIGFASAKLLASKGAKVHSLDLTPPEEQLPHGVEYTRCDVTSWSDLYAVFKRVRYVDITIANAGITETSDYLADTFDSDGQLLEPAYPVLDVNYRSVLNFVKLSVSTFRRQENGGSIVIVSSATAYSPEHSLPVYGSAKLALIGLMRCLRTTLPLSNISINAIVPAATITKLLSEDLAKPIVAAGLPVSSADHVARAVVFSAVANQEDKVESYGKDSDDLTPGRWNGRTILTLGDTYTELEGPLASLKGVWFGAQNEALTRKQQMATDFRES